MDVKNSTSILERLESLDRGPYGCHRQSHGSVGICKFWLAGNCTRNPCRFLHSEVPASAFNHGHGAWNRNHSSSRQSHFSERKNPDITSPMESDEEYLLTEMRQKAETYMSTSRGNKKIEVGPSAYMKSKRQNTSNRICQYWMNGNCVHGAKCKFLHSWYSGDGISAITQLEGHKKAVTGIVLPSGFDKLYTGSKDGTVRVWNCHTAQCEDIMHMGAEVGCLYAEGSWVFVGLPKHVKALNIQTRVIQSLSGPVGLVYAIEVCCDTLFAGAHDGAISAWKFNSETSSFELAASLKGHSRAVVSLVVGGDKLHSGSIDNTIRTWDLKTLQCTHVLTRHTQVVMSLLCWDSFLLSCSLDHKLVVWAATEQGALDEYYTHEEEHGILALHGMLDSENKPILLCSCNDNSTRLYELPSFTERGRLFARQEVRTLQRGPGGLFFTGEGTGVVSVWKLNEKEL